jgi:HJR/Mrr/RecB family endonuclease
MRQHYSRTALLHSWQLLVEEVEGATSQKHDLLGKITARDVDQARHRMELRYQEWLSLGSANPSNATTSQANDRRQETWKAWKHEIRASRRVVWSYALTKCLYYPVRYLVPLLRYLSKWNDMGMFGAILTIGAFAASLGAVVAVIFCSKLASGLAVVASAFVLGVAISLGSLHVVPGPTEEALQQIERRRREQELRRERARLQYEIADRECFRLEKVALTRDRYEEAKQQYELYRGIHQSKKHQLLLRDWRSLRGTSFEEFLQEVFEDLGYSVQTTKASGDQGVDLIVTINGYRVAIQSKGYESSVGNSSVQEVYAGMQFYHCDACAVITNSHFTRAAVDLANSTGCQLIEGNDIPKLVLGELVLLINSK